MSADNWTKCPRCKANYQTEYVKAVNDIDSQYGKLDKNEWLSRYEQLQRRAEPNNNTFKEDYEFYGAETGTLSIRYTGRCTECNLFLEFNHDIRFYPETDS